MKPVPKTSTVSYETPKATAALMECLERALTSAENRQETNERLERYIDAWAEWAAALVAHAEQENVEKIVELLTKKGEDVPVYSGWGHDYDEHLSAARTEAVITANLRKAEEA